jgi:predicted permease
LRNIRKHALLSIVVVATLTLGIGISAGVFTYFNAEFLRAHVDKDYASFVKVYSAYTNDPARRGRPGDTTLEDYLAFSDGAKSLGNLAAYADFYAPLGKGDPVEVRTLLVTSNFFSLYNLEQPLMGRLLQPEDCRAASQVVVLSEQLWRNRFAADAEIIGKVVHFNDRPVTVVGVTPNFAGMVNNARAWFPYTLESYLKHGDNSMRSGEAAWLKLEGRLNPGFSHEEAASELRLIASQQDRLHPGRTNAITVTDGSWIQQPEDRDKITTVFAVILGALTLFVLIVCVNVTTLLLSRAAARRQEIAVRLALGAGRMRLVRTLLTETLLLATLAGLASFYLAYHIPGILLHWLSNQSSETGGTWWSLAPDWRVFGYLMLVTILAGTMAGLTPALQSLKVNLSEMLKGRASLTGGARGSWLYGLLIGAQVALSFFLLYGAGLCANAAEKAASFEPGFETRQVLWARLFMQSNSAEQHAWGTFHRMLAERIAALPGVQSVAYSYRHPFNDKRMINAQVPGQAMREVAINWVSANYFATLEIPILSGRAIQVSDPPCGNGGCSVVVSERLAREFWPNESALGKTLQDARGNSFEVAGVARDVSSTRLGGPDDPMIYMPWNPNGNYPASPFVRFSGDAAALSRGVTATIREIAPELSVTARTIQSLREELMGNLGRMTQLIVVLCAIAIILAVIGIYGVVAFAVTQRTRELGIRVALGAQKKDIYSAVLRANGRPIAVGLIIGLALTVAIISLIAPLLRNLEFTLNISDPLSYAMTAISLAVVALAAMLVPARRATKIDPIVALRHE